MLLGGWLYFFHIRYTFPETLLILGLVVLFAFFPDVDTTSKGQYLFYGIILAVDIFFLIRGAYRLSAIIGFLALLPILGSHRGWTHTLLAMVIVPSPILILPCFVLGMDWKAALPYYLAAVTGYFSHLAIDRKFL